MSPCLFDKMLILETEKTVEEGNALDGEKKTKPTRAKSCLLRTSRLYNLKQERECGGKEGE